MDEFRRFIIKTSDILLVCAIFGFTIVGGSIGYFLGKGAAGLNPHSSIPAIGIFVGAIAGFATASISAALMFMLGDIAANTRTTVALLQGLTMPTQEPPPQHQSQPSAPMMEPAEIIVESAPQPTEPVERQPPASDIAKSISEDAINVLRIAKGRGYQIQVTAAKDAVVLSYQGHQIYLFSDEEILRFGRDLR